MRVRRTELLMVACFCLAWTASAQEKSFQLHGVTVELEDVTPEVDVYYRSMRFNRAAGTWNVEVLLSNKSSRVFSGPLIYYVAGFTNTSGPLQPDGLDGVQPFYDVSASAADGVLNSGELSQPFTLSLGVTSGAPSLTNRIFARGPPGISALAFTRTLNDAGLPLPSVRVDGTGDEAQTDDAFGLATITLTGTAGRLRFSASGLLPVWRIANVTSNGVGVIPHPRLTRRDTNTVTLTPIAGGTLSRGSPPIEMSFTPGTFSQNTTARLTPLTGQTLPLFLPQGWSPLGAFWLELSSEPALPGSALLTPWGQISPSETAALVRLNTNTLAWEVLQLVNGNGTNAVNVALSGSGAYALVVADAAPIAPPNTIVGGVLAPSTSPSTDSANLRAGGTVTPNASPASRIPELVTATAEVLVTNLAGNLPSGTLLRGEVSERYTLRDGTRRFPALFDNFVVGYQRPGDARLDTLRAEFPIRPLLLFGAEELQEAVVHMDLFAPGAFTGGILETNGGQVASEGLRVLAGLGDLLTSQAVQLKRLDVTNFTEFAGSNAAVVAAFEIGVNGVVVGRKLVVQLSGLVTNANFVLARVLARDGLYGLEPRERLHSDGVGNLVSDEPTTADRLPGLNGAGQYVLLKIYPLQGLVSGIARNSSGQPAGGLPLRVAGQPWLTFSARDGAFKLLAPAGDATLTVTDLVTGDSGAQLVNVPNPQTPVNTQLASVSSGPRVVSVTPTNNATGVSRVVPIVITFSEPVNPGTLIGTNVQLLGTNGAAVAASLTLNLKLTIVTLLPTDPLTAGTAHRIVLSGNITDLGGLRLEGTNEFTFRTQAEVARPETAKLTIFQPGGTNIPPEILNQAPGYDPAEDREAVVAHGSPGTAEAEVPVILVNENSGETVTVLSKPDGSFTSFIRATEEDSLTAVFVNANGTRTAVPASEQRFDDGRVGLFQQGGVVEVPSPAGPVQVSIAPGTIKERNVFKVEPLSLAQLTELSGNTPPVEATLLTGMKVTVEGLPNASGEANVSLPFNPAAFNIDDPENGAYVLTIIRTNDEGGTVFQVVDRVRYQDGKLYSNTLPFLGFMAFAASTAFGFVAEEVAGYVLGVLFTGKDGVPLLAKVSGVTIGSGGSPSFQPLSGALVTIHPTSLIFRTPGRIPTGLAFATTDASGQAALLSPRILGPGAGHYVSATHPRYDDIDTEPLTTFNLFHDLGGNVKEFRLEKPATPIDPLKVSSSYVPLTPPIGGPATFEVTATHSAGAPTIQVTVDSVLSLLSNVPLPTASVQLSNKVETTDGKLKRVRQQVVPPPGEKVVVTLRVLATGGGSVFNDRVTIPFTGEAVTLQGPLPVVDPNDSVGPMVVFSSPQAGGALNPGQALTLRFNEPVDGSVTNTPSAVTVSGPGSPFRQLTLSADQQTLDMQVARMEPDKEYTLTINQAVVDLRGNAFDKDPATPGPQSFTLKFRSPPTVTTPLPNLTSGGGATMYGNAAFTLDRTKGSEKLVVFDVSDPTLPRRAAEFRLPPFPRDLCLIPGYDFVNTFGQPALSNRNIIVVVGGEVGFAGNSAELPQAFVGQWLRAIDVTDPENPTRSMGAILTRREAVVSKIVWRPPFLLYLERTADFQQVGVINFQEMVVGFNTPDAHLFGLFPEDGQPGEDKNGDGDFVDQGDVLPLPRKIVPEFFGKVPGLTASLAQTTQGILDFDFEQGYLSVVLSAGQKLGFDGMPTGAALPPQFRTLSFAGDFLPETTGIIPFAVGARPKRVAIIAGVPVDVGGTLELRVVALVSLSPDADGRPKLAVIDVTLAASPRLVRLITFPQSMEAALGLFQSVELRPDGLIQLATSSDLILLDPTKLSLPNAPQDGLHPAVVSILPAAGASSITFGFNEAGVSVIALGGRAEVVQTSPRLRFVSFTNEVFNPLQGFPTGLDLRSVVENAPDLPFLEPALLSQPGQTGPNNFDPPLPGVHYYVLVDAPGGIGTELELGLESLNRSGFPYANRGRGFAPVRAASSTALAQIEQQARSGCDAPIRVLRARRLADDWRNPLYNKYLSEPFALVTQKTAADQLQTLAQNPERQILWSGFYLRAFIDYGMIHPVAQPFAATIDSNRKVIVPRASVIAETLPGGYLMGQNPPPPGGGIDVPGTFGTLSAHNGEFRHETVDVALPGRRMPIVFERTIGGQDLHDGPFGRGWDHVFDQQVTYLRKEFFSPGRSVPLIVRVLVGDNTTAEAGDVILQTGAGRNILFKNKGDQPPPELAGDLLVNQLNWKQNTAEYFLPDSTEKGVFDLLFKFVDGQFARLTPDGMQYWYSAQGRLEKIYHRYTDNAIKLSYNERGDLVRLIDLSIPGDQRFLEIGYYRFSSDPDKVSGLDEVTSEPFVSGRIARLKDYTDREILFQYNTDGLLEKREGPRLNGANGGFSGLPTTVYLWSDACSGAAMGVVAGNGANSTPLFVATLTTDNPEANGGNGAAGNVGYSAPAQNQAGVEGAQSSSTGPDGSQTQFTFDKFGFPKKVDMSGARAGPASVAPKFNSLGLLEEVTYPMGNSVKYTYDVNNSNLRSRGDLIKEEHFPGTRPTSPGKLEATFAYDARYNLQSGAQTDFNGNSITYTLTGDGKDVERISHAGAGTHEFDYDSLGQLRRVETPEGLVTSYGYDDSTGFRTSENRGPSPIGYGYDGTRAGQLGVPTSVNMPAGASITAKYDDRLMLTEMTRGSYTETRGYDENGNLVSLSRSLGGGKTYEETRVYNQINFLESITVKNVETGSGAGDLITRFTPDAAWRVKQIDLPGGEIRKFEYDHLGYLRHMDIGSYSEDYVRDLHGNLLTLERRGIETQTMDYDGYDRPTTIINKGAGGNEITTLTYFGKGERKLMTVEDPVFGVVLEVENLAVDALGRPTSVIRRGNQTSASIGFSYPGGSVIQSGPRETVTTEHDAGGRVTVRKNSAADVTLTPDLNGNVLNVLSSETGGSYTASFGYDNLDHRTSHSDGVGPRFGYTPRLDGLPTGVRDGLGRETIMDYSVLGEQLSATRPNNVAFRYAYDQNRQPAFVGDPSAGHSMKYDDGTLRITEKELRDGSTLSFSSANNPVNLPESITIPGGTMTMGYDLQGRVISQNISYGPGEGYQGGYGVDALGRVRTATYGSGGQHNATYTYDKLGPLTSTTYDEALGSFTVASQINSDGTRSSVTYPSETLQETRHTSGRLETITGPGGVLYNVSAFAGADIPGQIELGGVLRETINYDGRKRIVGRHYARVSSGEMLADSRHKYDFADNVLARQQVHRHGRADVFTYDNGNRLKTAELGARPQISGAVRNDPPPAGLQGGEGFAEGLYARIYIYDGGGLDLLQTITKANPDALTIPPFANSLSGHNAFLNAGMVDSSTRTSDPQGNTTATLLATRPGGSDPVLASATLTYNGLSQLVKVELPGITITYEHQPNGLMHHRTVTQGGNVVTESAFVWNEGRLIEEYQKNGGSVGLRARFYYADDDSPFAGDIFDGGTTNRFYFLRDALSSVVAVADAGGQVVERINYDAWGQPEIQGRDIRPPLLAGVFPGGSSDLLIVFTEPVLPPRGPAPPGTTLLSSLGGFATGNFSVTGTNGQPVTVGGLAFEENLGGFPFGSAIRLNLQGVIPPVMNLRILGGTVADEWGLLNAEVQVTFTNGVPAVGSPLGSTAPPRLARSAIGNPFLFHGQYFDYDAGLVYLRARFYDPFTGHFLQRDPDEYEDSINLYAGMGNNPTSRRDPSGRMAGRVGRALVNLANRALRPVAAETTERAVTSLEKTVIMRRLLRSEQLIEQGSVLRKLQFGSPLKFFPRGAEVLSESEARSIVSRLAKRHDITHDIKAMEESMERLGSKNALERYRGVRDLEERFGLHIVDNSKLPTDLAKYHREFNPTPGFGGGSSYNPVRFSDVDRVFYVDRDLVKRIVDNGDSADIGRLYKDLHHDVLGERLGRLYGGKAGIPVVQIPADEFMKGVKESGRWLTHYLDDIIKPNPRWAGD